MKPKKLSELKPAPYNPRTIPETAAKGLATSLQEFGDISGIVFNIRTGHLVTGHQRIQQLKRIYGDLELKDDLIVTPDGHTFKVRFVDWDEDREKLANLVANNPHIQGTFTSEVNDIVAELVNKDAELVSNLLVDVIHVDQQIVDDVVSGNDYELEDIDFSGEGALRVRFVLTIDARDAKRLEQDLLMLRRKYESLKIHL